MKDFYGPWSFELSTLEVHDKDGDLVVDADSGDFLKGKSAEFGALIAAAPELLDALQSCEQLLSGMDSLGFSGLALLENARDALAKALGENP